MEHPLDSLSPGQQRRNFVLGVVNGALFMMADLFLDSEMVITWFLAQLGVSNWVIGLVSPIRNGGWFLPQIFVSGYLQRQPRKMPFYQLTVVVRSALLLCLALPVALLPVHSPWLLTLFFTFLVAYSLGSGLAGIPFMDMVGKVIPAMQRGTFFGQRMFWGNLFALGSSSLIGFLLTEPNGLQFPRNFAVILALAFVWLTVSMVSWCFVREPAEAVNPRPAPWTEQIQRGVRLLRDRAPYRAFVLSRLALMVAQLASPFYIVYAKTALGIPARMVGVYLAARTAASILSNLLWGRISDRRGNRLLIQASTVVGLSMPVGALVLGLVSRVLPEARPWLSYAFTGIFVAAGAFNAGSMIGNTSYLLDIAPSAERALYLGFTNTLFGIGVFTSSLGGLIVDWAGFGVLMALSACFYGLALFVSLWMVEPMKATEPRLRKS